MPTKGTLVTPKVHKALLGAQPSPPNATSVPVGVTASSLCSKEMAVKGERGILFLSLFFFCLRQRRQFLSICPKKGRKLNLFLQGCHQPASIESQGCVAEAVSVSGRGREGAWGMWSKQGQTLLGVGGGAKIWDI